MTGLDVNKEQILEIGIVISDNSLSKTILGPNIIMSCPDTILENMDKWNKDHHSESGLIQEVKNSTISVE